MEPWSGDGRSKRAADIPSSHQYQLIEASIEKYVLDSFLVFLGVLKAKTLRILGLGSGSSSSVPSFPFRFSEIIGLRLTAAMLYEGTYSHSNRIDRGL
jgi:hypothetical protein